jgi:hypothetical protein
LCAEDLSEGLLFQVAWVFLIELASFFAPELSKRWIGRTRWRVFVQATVTGEASRLIPRNALIDDKMGFGCRRRICARVDINPWRAALVICGNLRRESLPKIKRNQTEYATFG